MKKRPLAVLACLFALGIIFANRVGIDFLFFYLPALALLILSLFLLRDKRSFEILLLILSFLLGALWLKNYRALPPEHIYRLSSGFRRTNCLVKGIIISQPEIKSGRMSFIFKTEEVVSKNRKYRSCGKSLVYLDHNKSELNYAEELIINGSLSRPFSFSRNNHGSWRSYLAGHNIYLVLKAKGPRAITRLKIRTAFLKGFPLRLKEKMKKIILKYIAPLPASIVLAMALGDKSMIPAFVNRLMIKTGTVHILVVSGFNVGIIAFISLVILKIFRFSRKARFFIAVFILIIYCLLTGASTPVVRATLMAVTFMSAYWFKRQPDIYNSLALAMLCILIINPQQLFNAGFQLSFASVFAIVYLYPKVHNFLHLKNIDLKPLRISLEAASVSFSAWLGTAGFILYYFKIFSPVTVLANIFIVPLAGLITLCGLSLIAAAFLFPVLAPFFARTTELLAILVIAINSFLAKLPAASFTFP